MTYSNIHICITYIKKYIFFFYYLCENSKPSSEISLQLWLKYSCKTRQFGIATEVVYTFGPPISKSCLWEIRVQILHGRELGKNIFLCAGCSAALFTVPQVWQPPSWICLFLLSSQLKRPIHLLNDNDDVR